MKPTTRSVLVSLALSTLLTVPAAAQPILHEFFVVDEAGSTETPAPSLAREPVHTPEGAIEPGGNHPDRPGARNAPARGASDLSLDRDTDREGWLTYYAVFDPTVAPFKRVGARDRVTLERGEVRLALSEREPRRLRLTGGSAPGEDEAFVGVVLVDVEPGVWVPIPSVSADMVIHRYQTEPTVGVEFFRDGADNVLIRADHQGQVRLTYWVSAPRGYFGGALPAGASVADMPPSLVPVVPVAVVATANELRALIGLADSADLAATVAALAQYFRGFLAEPFPPDRWTEDVYRDILFGGRGVCRHRTFAFVVTAQAWGIPARYVYNEAHTFAEVFLPGLGWRRVDLGGGAEGLHVMNASSRPLHRPPVEDPLPQPDAFAEGYSRQIGEELSRRPVQETGSRSGQGGARVPVEMAEWDPFADATSDLESLPEGRAWDGPPLPRRRLTVVTASGAPDEVYRGDRLSLRVSLEDAEGASIPGRSVRVYLGPPSGAERGRVIELARLTTGAGGVAEGAVTVPHSLPLGVWGVYVVFTGDDEYAPSRSR